MLHLKAKYKNFLSDDTGATAVEAALCLPIILILGFGIFQYGVFYNNSTDINDGFQKASRQVKLTEYPSEDELKSLFQQALGDEVRNVTFSVNRVERYGESFAEVNMVYSHSIDIPLLNQYPLQANYQNLILLSGEIETDS